MISINLERLNPLETTIHQAITRESQVREGLTITEAASLCGCSVSKVSKFVKKLGFDNYKQYINYVYGSVPSKKETTNEIERIKQFLESFDAELVEQLVELIDQHKKIILFGYGPSYICAQYFEYKLRTVTAKTVITAPDEFSAERAMDEESLLIIFTTTGNFKSFNFIYHKAKENKCDALFLVEEYNAKMLKNYDKVFFLTDYVQSSTLMPYEKSRTIFFIFIEEVIQVFLNRKKTDSL